MEHPERGYTPFSLDRSVLSRVCCLLSDIGLHCCRVTWSLLHWPLDRSKILSVLEGRDYILNFLAHLVILNNDLHIVGHHLIPLKSLKAICLRAELGS